MAAVGGHWRCSPLGCCYRRTHCVGTHCCCCTEREGRDVVDVVVDDVVAGRDVGGVDCGDRVDVAVVVARGD